MLKRCPIFIYLLCIFIPTLLLRASDSGVVINRFQIDSENGNNDEYVEILNTSASSVDLSGWKLAKKSASTSANPVYLRTIIPEGTALEPGKGLVIAHPDCACASDLLYATSTGSIPSSGIATDNSIILFNKEKVTVDVVGFGASATFEGSPISSSPKTGEVYKRKENGQDTDNNKEDFYLSYKPPVEEEPTEEKDSTEDSTQEAFPEATAGAKIQVSEFMLNPEGSDTEGEWIEIYNAGSNANISGYAIADRLGSPKKYTFPKGTTIKAGQYLAFYSGKTPISLNNDGDAVEVRSPEGVVIHYSKESGKGAEGLSFAWSGKSWEWTKRPTPGQKNVFEAPSADEISGKKTTDQKGAVLSLVDESQLPTESEIAATATARKNDQLLGYGLIVLAILGGISYTLYVNWEKIREYYYNNIRKTDHLSGRKIRQRVKGWRSISSKR